MKLGEVLLSVLLVVSWTWPAGGLTEVEFLDDMEGKVRLLARHALFLQLAAEANDCGKHHHFSISTFSVRPSKVSSTAKLIVSKFEETGEEGQQKSLQVLLEKSVKSLSSEMMMMLLLCSHVIYIG